MDPWLLYTQYPYDSPIGQAKKHGIHMKPGTLERSTRIPPDAPPGPHAAERSARHRPLGLPSSIGMMRATQYEWENEKFMATSYHQPVFFLRVISLFFWSDKHNNWGPILEWGFMIHSIITIFIVIPATPIPIPYA